MNLAELTELKLLVPRLLSNRLPDALRELTLRLENTGRISNSEASVEVILRREEQWPTVIAPGVAVPHVRGPAVRELSLAVGLSQRGVRWGSGDGAVHQVFLFAVPLASTNSYLSAASALTRMIQEQGVFAELIESRQPETMREVLSRISLPGEDAPLQPRSSDT
jgi:mannitol/fructose-specific phosphotransferase system IIA component (Ntr-type)